jgi:ankyrin repeat protein
MEYYGQRQESEDHLFKSAQLGDLDRLKECLKNTEYGIDVTTLNVNQSTVLHFACRYGHLHIVQYLTQRYDETIINVNTRNKDGCTPLHFASSSGHLPIVTYLIEEEDCHLFVDDMTNDGDTAYDLALRFQHFDVSDYLSLITNCETSQTKCSIVAASTTKMCVEANNGTCCESFGLYYMD